MNDDVVGGYQPMPGSLLPMCATHSDRNISEDAVSPRVETWCRPPKGNVRTSKEHMQLEVCPESLHPYSY